MTRLLTLLTEIRACRRCDDLPLGPRPVLRATTSARLLIIGQAPGTRVHASGVPWDDASGDRLRAWLGLGRDAFYDDSRIAIVPMGLCYPGKGASGDLPPRPECAPAWQPKLFPLLRNVRLTLLVGAYAQTRMLGDARKATLTETVRAFREYLPRWVALPHPSPRNAIWRKKNAWFERDVVPIVRTIAAQALAS